MEKIWPLITNLSKAKAKKLLNSILSSYLRTLTCGRHRLVRILFLLNSAKSTTTDKGLSRDFWQGIDKKEI